MQSEQVKAIVAKTNGIVQTGDTTLDSNEARNLVSSLLLSLCSLCNKNYYFAVAIYQHLLDSGFEMNNVRGDASTLFMDKFGKTMNGLDATQLVTIRRVAESLFSPTRI